MRIKYKFHHTRTNLLLALLWFIAGVFQLLFNENADLFDSMWFVFSGIYFLIYLYQIKKDYLIISNGSIKQKWPFGRTMKLADIQRIRHFDGQYVLRSKRSKLTIDIGLIQKDSLQSLKSELKKLKPEWV